MQHLKDPFRLAVLFQVNLLMHFQSTILKKYQCSLVRFAIFYEITLHKIGGSCNMFWEFMEWVKVLILRAVLTTSLLFDSNVWFVLIVIYFCT